MPWWARSHSTVPSVGIRPYVVYGPGRDQGMTAGPTLAMEAGSTPAPDTAELQWQVDVQGALMRLATHDHRSSGGSRLLDESRRLRGLISLRELILAKPSAKLADIMH